MSIGNALEMAVKNADKIQAQKVFCYFFIIFINRQIVDSTLTIDISHQSI